MNYRQFSDDSVRRLRLMLRWFELQPHDAVPVPSRRRPNVTPRFAITTSTISHGSSETSPGSGTANLACLISGTIAVIDPHISVTVHNPHDKQIASGKTILVTIVDGVYVVFDVYSCTDLS